MALPDTDVFSLLQSSVRLASLWAQGSSPTWSVSMSQWIVCVSSDRLKKAAKCSPVTALYAHQMAFSSSRHTWCGLQSGVNMDSTSRLVRRASVASSNFVSSQPSIRGEPKRHQSVNMVCCSSGVKLVYHSWPNPFPSQPSGSISQSG